MTPSRSGATPYHYTTHSPGAWVPAGPVPLAPVQGDRHSDLARLEHVLYDQIANANAEAQAKGSVPRRYPVARVKHIMKRSVQPHRRITMSHDAVLAMTNLTQVMTACIAKVTWERTKQRYAGSSSTRCVQLMDAVSATSSMPQFDVCCMSRTPSLDTKTLRNTRCGSHFRSCVCGTRKFLIDVNAAAMEEKRKAEQAQEEQRLIQQVQALQEQQAILAYQIRAPELVMHQPLNTATGTVNGGAVPLPAYNLTAFAPNLQMP